MMIDGHYLKEDAALIIDPSKVTGGIFTIGDLVRAVRKQDAEIADNFEWEESNPRSGYEAEETAQEIARLILEQAL